MVHCFTFLRLEQLGILDENQAKKLGNDLGRDSGEDCLEHKRLL